MSTIRFAKLTTSFMYTYIWASTLIGMALCFIPTILQSAGQASGNLCVINELLLSAEMIVSSEITRFSFVAGTTLGCLAFLEIVFDLFMLRQRTHFESMVLFAIALQLFVPNITLLLWNDFHNNALGIMTIFSTFSVLLVNATTLSLLVYYDGKPIFSSRVSLVSLTLYIIYVVLSKFAILLPCDSQVWFRSYITTVFKSISMFLIIIPIVRWVHYMARKEKKDITSQDIYCSGMVALFSVYVIWNTCTLALIGNYSAAPLGTLAAGSTRFLICNTMYTLFSVLVITANARVFRYEATLLQERQKLLLEQKKVFVRYVSHEMRTPLNTAMMGLQLLKRQIQSLKEGPKKRKFVESVNDLESSCSTAVGILDELLDYEKLDAGLMTLDMETVSIRPFVDSIVASFRIYADEKGIRLTVSTSGEDDLRDSLDRYAVTADESKLSQVLRNMLSNALKFTPSGGTVTVDMGLVVNESDSSTPALVETSFMSYLSTRLFPNQSVTTHGENKQIFDNMQLRISVSDTGPGISKENQLRLFNEVIQFSPGKLQGGKGTGLGLWISNKIMKLHGGNISVFSEGEGQGSTFAITLGVHAVSGDGDGDGGVTSLSDAGPTGTLAAAYEGARVARDVAQSGQGSDTRLAVVVEDGNHSDSDEEVEGEGEGEEFVFAAGTERAAGGIGKVLVVDDVSLNRKVLCRLLEGNCSGSDTAEDGQIAVDLVRRSIATGEPYYAVLMDSQMPNMDGPTAAKAIRELGYCGIMLGVTGNALPSDIEYFMSCGLNKVLTKPVNLSDVMSALTTKEYPVMDEQDSISL